MKFFVISYSYIASFKYSFALAWVSMVKMICFSYFLEVNSQLHIWLLKKCKVMSACQHGFKNSS